MMHRPISVPTDTTIVVQDRPLLESPITRHSHVSTAHRCSGVDSMSRFDARRSSAVRSLLGFFVSFDRRCIDHVPIVRLFTRLGCQIACIFVAIGICGCRGNKSAKPPVHLQLNMDFQKRIEAQEESTFFQDGRGMRPAVANTVAVGSLVDDERLAYGTTTSGSGIRIETEQGTKHFVDALPMPLTRDLLDRGQERYGIYCSMCHGTLGDGDSILKKRNIAVQPTSYFDARVMSMPDGYYFHVITHGVRNMPAYGYQIPVTDRWAIVSYMRALQLAGSATRRDIPDSIVKKEGWR